MKNKIDALLTNVSFFALGALSVIIFSDDIRKTRIFNSFSDKQKTTAEQVAKKNSDLTIKPKSHKKNVKGLNKNTVKGVKKVEVKKAVIVKPKEVVKPMVPPPVVKPVEVKKVLDQCIDDSLPKENPVTAPISPVQNVQPQNSTPVVNDTPTTTTTTITQNNTIFVTTDYGPSGNLANLLNQGSNTGRDLTFGLQYQRRVYDDYWLSAGANLRGNVNLGIGYSFK